MISDLLSGWKDGETECSVGRLASRVTMKYGTVSESSIPPVCSSTLPTPRPHQKAVILIHRKFHHITTVQRVTCKALRLMRAKE